MIIVLTVIMTYYMKLSYNSHQRERSHVGEKKKQSSNKTNDNSVNSYNDWYYNM